MRRTVVDANVLVSALCFPGSVPRQAFDAAIHSGRVLLSLALLHEINNVLSRPKLARYVTTSERIRFLVTLVGAADMVETTTEITACRDVEDNHVLELAVDGRATHIVTGDGDLLALDPFRAIRIIPPQAFLKTLAR